MTYKDVLANASEWNTLSSDKLDLDEISAVLFPNFSSSKS